VRSPDVAIGLIDGPVALRHPDLAGRVIELGPVGSATCATTGAAACRHGTFVAGVLVGRRASPAPALCPDSTLLLRPLFSEHTDPGVMPAASQEELANAVVDCVGGRRV
jgi:hypothetical protein